MQKDYVLEVAKLDRTDLKVRYTKSCRSTTVTTNTRLRVYSERELLPWTLLKIRQRYTVDTIQIPYDSNRVFKWDIAH